MPAAAFALPLRGAVLFFACAMLLAPGARAQTAPALPPPGSLSVTVGGLLQSDAWFFPGDGARAATDRFFLRRARIRAEARLDGFFHLVAEPDFGRGTAVLADAWAEAATKGGWSVRAGRLRVPFGLEVLRSSAAIWFAERGFPTALAPGRDVGLMVQHALPDARLVAAAGVFNGVPDGQSHRADFSDARDVAARVFARPFGGRLGGLALGLAANVGREHGQPEASALAAYGTPGAQTFYHYADGVVAEGTRWRLAPQGFFAAGRLGVLAEYTRVHHALRVPGGSTPSLEHDAWQLAAAWTLTGEGQRFEPLQPRAPLDAGGRGALEIAFRLHGITLDARAPRYAAGADARRARAWGAALNWYPTLHTRVGLTVERTHFPGARPHPDAETLVAARAQVRF